MRQRYSSQFRRACVVVDEGDRVEDVIELANDIGARYYDGEDNCYVVEFTDTTRPAGPELYTGRALRRSFKPPAKSA